MENPKTEKKPAPPAAHLSLKKGDRVAVRFHESPGRLQVDAEGIVSSAASGRASVLVKRHGRSDVLLEDLPHESKARPFEAYWSDEPRL